MGIIKDTLFGGSEKKAAQAQANATKEAMQITREGVEEAKKALDQMSPLALQMLGGSAQQGIDLLGAAAQNQANVAQQGNVKAQEQIANSLPMIQAALMGQPLDFSKMQATKLQLPGMDFLKQNVSPLINIPRTAPSQFDKVGQSQNFNELPYVGPTQYWSGPNTGSQDAGSNIARLLSGLNFGGNSPAGRVDHR